MPVPATVVTPATAIAHHSNHNAGENHPKVPWSVKVPLDMYDFIREHDNYRPFLKDQRPFREKFLEWVTNVRANVAPDLNVAKDAAVRTRTHSSESVAETAPSTQPSGKIAPSKNDSENL